MMETKWKTRADGECAQRDAEEVFAFADQGEDGVQQAERIKGGGHAQPDDTHFGHGRIGNFESEIPVYRDGQRIPLPPMGVAGAHCGVITERSQFWGFAF